MKQVINIAMFGLSLDIANELKASIQKLIPPTQTIQWVNIASKELDLLLVSDPFFNANTIQSIIKNKSCKFLRLLKDPKKGGEILADGLYYPFDESYDLAKWIQQEFGDVQTITQTTTAATSSSIFPSNTVNQLSQNFRTTVNELLNPRNGFVRIYDQAGEIGIVDTRTERLWLNAERQYHAITPTFSQSYAKNSISSSIQHQEVKDLRVWLWQIIFNSNAYQVDPLKENEYYKLTAWPQLKKRIERKEILKVSACFARGAKVQHVLQHIEINKNHLAQFLYTAQLLNMLERINSDQAKFATKKNTSEVENSGVFRGFLSKLRKKLGV